MKRKKGHALERVQMPGASDGRTKQSFQFDGDPNTLMKRFSKSGDRDIFNTTKQIARYGDFSEIPDFFTANLQVQEMEEEFLSFPSHVRNHVNNSVEELLELLVDPSRVDEAIELGLVAESTTKPMEIPLRDQEKESPVQGGEDPEPKTTSSTLGTTGRTGASQSKKPKEESNQ